MVQYLGGAAEDELLLEDEAERETTRGPAAGAPNDVLPPPNRREHDAARSAPETEAASYDRNSVFHAGGFFFSWAFALGAVIEAVAVLLGVCVTPGSSAGAACGS